MCCGGIKLFRRHLAILSNRRVFALAPAPPWLIYVLVALGFAAGLADGVTSGLVILLLYSMIGRAGDLFSSNGFLGKILASIAFGNSAVIGTLIVLFLVANIG